MRKLFFFLAFTVLIAMPSARMALADDASNKPIIAIIVAHNQDVQSLKLTPTILNLIYWRKQRYWPKGLPIKPVNLNAENPLRTRFSTTVLGSTPQAQIDYWNGQYFNGVLPPHSVNSEEAVMRYLSKTRGAIGYINACRLDKRVKPLLWIYHGKISRTKPALHC